jgi:hypothetical protein
VNESNGDLVFNERSTYLKDWPPFKVQIQVLYSKTLRDDNYMELNNINVDPCMLHKFFSGNFILRSFLENYEKASINEIGCRHRKVCLFYLFHEIVHIGINMGYISLELRTMFRNKKTISLALKSDPYMIRNVNIIT